MPNPINAATASTFVPPRLISVASTIIASAQTIVVFVDTVRLSSDATYGPAP